MAHSFLFPVFDSAACFNQRTRRQEPAPSVSVSTAEACRQKSSRALAAEEAQNRGEH